MNDDEIEIEELVVLVNGSETSGRDFWAYVAMLPEKHEAFLDAEKRGGYRLNDYGRILASGMGKIPPQDVSRRFAEA